jgi:hypothetical protein
MTSLQLRCGRRQHDLSRAAPTDAGCVAIHVPRKLIRQIKSFGNQRGDADRAKLAAAGNFCRDATLLSGPAQMV